MLHRARRRRHSIPADHCFSRENNVMDYPGAQMTDWVVATAMAARARAVELRA